MMKYEEAIKTVAAVHNMHRRILKEKYDRQDEIMVEYGVSRDISIIAMIYGKNDEEVREDMRAAGGEA